jgi:hypothetical protein
MAFGVRPLNAISAAISWRSAILGLIVKRRETANWTRFIVVSPLTFVNSVFVPTDTLPSELRVFAEKPTS